MTTTIAYCIMTGDMPKHFDGAFNNLKLIKQYVDHEIVVYDFFSEEHAFKMGELQPTLVKLPFDRYPNGYRNAYINKAKELGCDYILVTDSDETPNEQLLKDLRTILNNNPSINQFRILQRYHLEGAENLDEGMLAPYSERFHKALIFKLEPWYQEPSAIEPVTNENPRPINFEDWHIINLPDEYFFTHNKSYIDVWYGAARDWWLGQWAPTRHYEDIFKTFKTLATYKDFSEFNQALKDGSISDELENFILENRSSEITDLRSLFNYYKYLHPEISLVSEYKPSSLSKNEETITKSYLEILHRHPDNTGLHDYLEKIQTRNYTKKEIDQELKTSNEFVDYELNTTFVRYFGRIPTYLEKQLWTNLYRMGFITNIKEVVKFLVEVNQLGPDRIAYCQMCYNKNFDEALENATKIKPYVDETIIVYDDLPIEQIEKLKSNQISAYWKRWGDNFPENRNYYIQLARELSCGWVACSDPDEHFDDNLIRNLKLLAKNANTGENRKYAILQINSHDVFTDDDNGKPVEKSSEVVSDYYKGLFFKVLPDTRYEGVGETKNLHEHLLSSGERANLDRQFFYKHIKTHVEIWEHAFRNLFVSGGGDNIGNANPDWKSLRDVCNNLNIHEWKELRSYCIKGDIDKSLKDWLIKHRNDWKYGYHSEHREAFKWYFIILHPDENTDNLVVDPKPSDEVLYDKHELVVVNLYKKHLLREPDFSGLNTYSQMLRENKITEAQLENAIVQSAEYKMKWPQGRT